MGDWHRTRLEQIGRIVTGKTPPTADPQNYGGNIPFVTPTDFDGRRIIETTGRYLTRKGASGVEAAILPAGAILVSCIGSDMGKSAIAGRGCVTNQQINSLIVNSDVSALFVYYNLSQRKEEIRAVAGGSAQPILNKSGFGRLEITLPASVGQQNAIASILGALDDKIDLNRRMNETLEAMARAIFKDWFVDFGPTRAKMEGHAPYLAPEIWALFPDRLDEEGKPAGWRFGTLEDFAEITMGASPDGSTYNDRGEGTPLVNGPFEYGDFFLRRIKWTTAPNKLSRRGDLIICVRGSTTGRLAFSDGEYCLGRGVASIHGKFGQQEFIDKCVFEYMDRLLQRTTGSVFPNLSSHDLRTFDILIPCGATRTAYCEVARSMRARVWGNVEQSATLAATRDLLLPRLMSGEISVQDAERLVEVAA